MRRALVLVALSLVAVALPTGAGPASALVGPGFVPAFAQDATAIAVLVLHSKDTSAVEARLEALGIDHHPYPHLGMVAARLSADQLGEVARWSDVRGLWPNEHMVAYLDRSAAWIGAPIVWDTYHVRGEGITVLVVDTGVDGTHPDVRYGENLIQNVVPTRLTTGLIGGHREGVVASDTDGHGTHVAGIVAGMARAVGGDASAGKYRGIAPASRLIGFEAGIPDSNGEPSFDTVTVLEAYDYALAHQAQYNIRVVTNSWGANGVFEPESPINQATLQLYLSGIVVPFAAGNEGDQGPGSLNKYSLAPWVFSVGAVTYQSQRASFSSIGTDPAASHKPYDHPDLMAPGNQITSAKASSDAGLVGNVLGSGSGDAGRQLYVTKSGTSMAAPHVAGTAALLFSKNPNLSPDEVYDLLTASATPIPNGPTWEVGVGQLSAVEAYRMSLGVPGGLRTFLEGNVKYAGERSGDPSNALDAVSVGLGNGTARSLSAADTTIPQFARGLVATPLGIGFLIAVLVLAFLAFKIEDGRLRRRGGLPARPLPFFGATALFVLVAMLAPRWTWQTSLYVGNVLVQLLVPDRLFGPLAIAWLVVVAAGIALLVWGLRPGSRRAVHGWLLLLGLVLLVYGFVTFADARVTADRVPGGSAVFLQFNYTGLAARPIQSTIGLLILIAGGFALAGCVGRRSRPEPERALEPRRPPAAAAPRAPPAPRRPSQAATR